ncbi:MAG: MFS transporter [Halobacteria archaeon]|nr:MFS transporter [Halobacteria archaeon]
MKIDRLGYSYPHVVLGLAVLANFSQFGARVVVSPLVPDIIADFGVSKSEVGLVLTGIWGVYALLQFPSGILADRVGEKRVITASLALVTVGSGVLYLSPSFVTFAVFALFLGAGAGLYFSVGTSLLTKIFGASERGQALGVHSTGGPLAGVVAPVVGAYVAARYGWRTALLFGGVVALPVLVGFVYTVRPVSDLETEKDGSDDKPGLIETVVSLVSRPRLVYTTLLGVSLSFAWQSFSSFFPTFVVEEMGTTKQTASLYFGAVFLLTAVFLPVMGRLSDSLGRDRLLGFSFVSMSTGILLFVVGETTLAVYAGILFLGAGMSWGGVLQSRAMDIISDSERGTGFGLVRTVYMLIGATGSAVTGTVAEFAGWGFSWGIVVGLLLVALVSLALNTTLDLGL